MGTLNVFHSLWDARSRLWRYFRDGYAIYVSKPVTIMNFLTLMFYIIVDRLSFLQPQFLHFFIFTFVGLLTLTPLSIFFGWWHIRKGRQYGKEVILATKNNPLTAHFQRVGMEQSLKVAKVLNVEVSKEWMDMYHFWKDLDEQMKWKP